MTGSTLKEIVEDPSLRVRKLVTQEKMHTLASGLTCFNDSARTSRRPHWRTWEFSIRGRSRQVIGFMWRLTFESPINVNEDIVKIFLNLLSNKRNALLFTLRGS